jgi:hypothetical protein
LDHLQAVAMFLVKGGAHIRAADEYITAGVHVSQ